MSNLIRIMVLLAAACLPGAASADAPRPVVIEFFTSQGCNTCPPADALAGRLAREPGILVLSLHVDYWDYLGWRDALARPENTRRQKAYAVRAHSRGIYTPQAVVQGTMRMVGADEAAIRAAIAETRAAPLRATVILRPRTDHVEVELVPGEATHFEESGLVQVVTYDRAHDVAISAGENEGLTISYTNVVRDWMKLGTWDGDGRRVYSAPLPMNGQGLLILLQDGPSGPILAAARLEL